MNEFWVEYDFHDSIHGYRPNRIRVFKNEQDAQAFVATTTDGKIVEAEIIEM